MLIQSVHVKNFRCIIDATLNCEPLTALVGPNGAGKSSFLRALEMFYATRPTFGPEDFYGNDTTREIEITVTFTDLDSDAETKFKPYMQGDSLSVTRLLAISDSAPQTSLHGSRMQNAEFQAIRNAPSKTEARSQYNELRTNPQYAELPSVQSAQDVQDAIRAWEDSHPERCVRLRDDGKFFGFTEVGEGYLSRYTLFISIPAVRDAAEDATEGRGSPITDIMNLVVRSTLAEREEIATLKTETQQRYQDIMADIAQKDKSALEATLTRTLKTYVPDASVNLELAAGNIDVPLPSTDVKLVEDGYSAAVGQTGHGLQRAFILTMLQHLAVAQGPSPREVSDGDSSETQGQSSISETSDNAVKGLPNLTLGIEEPELYQHPSRQRHLASILLQLASGVIAGVSKRTQILYTTHSPLFVGLDRFHQVRAFRKVEPDPEMPRATQVTQVDGDSVAAEIWEAVDPNARPAEKFTWSTLEPRLRSIMTPWMGEGFFADVVALVEGEDDRAAILGTARSMGHDIESEGIAVIPCGGKSNLDCPLAIFRRFGIRTFVIWDGDHMDDNAIPGENRRLLRLLGQPAEDFPSTQVMSNFACFVRSMDETLRGDIGEERFQEIMKACQAKFEIRKSKHAMKNPVVIEELINQAGSQGLSCDALQQIVTNILKLREAQTSEG